MKVLVAFERSGIVRNAFQSIGCDAVSCDLKESHLPGNHIVGDIRNIDLSQYDLLIAHPPCTHIACSGAKHFFKKSHLIQDSLNFVRWILDLPVKHIAIENPVGLISSHITKPDQIIHPYYFGDSYQKKTCLWLKSLPKLIPTKIVSPGEIHVTRTGKKIPKWYSNNKSLREITFPGFAQAMADQWSNPKHFQFSLF